MGSQVLKHTNRDELADTAQITGGDGRESRPNRRPHVAAILPRGEAIRNFVYTGSLDEVTAQADLTVLSVIPSRDIYEMLIGRYESVHSLQDLPERWVVRVLRDILNTAHTRWLWSKAAQQRWRRHNARDRTPRRWLKRQFEKLACYPFSSRRGLELLTKIERAASYTFRTTDHYVDLFRKTRPWLVFNGSHVHGPVAMQAVQAAQWLGIPTAAFLFSWDNLTSRSRVIPLYDYYLVWNESIRDRLLQVYPSTRPQQVFVTGTPQFDFHFRSQYYWTREEFCRRVGADPCRPIVLYSTGMSNDMPGEPRIVERIAAILRELKEFGRPQMLVRVYPKDRTVRSGNSQYEALKSTCPDVLFPEVPWESAWLTPRYEDAYLLTNTLRHAAVGVNVASTVSLELCMFDKPVINVGYNPPGTHTGPIDYREYYDFDHYRPVVESGAVMVARSEAEMRKMLIRGLMQPKADSHVRRSFLKGMFGETLDGCSGQRVAKQLITLAEEQRHASSAET